MKMKTKILTAMGSLTLITNFGLSHFSNMYQAQASTSSASQAGDDLNSDQKLMGTIREILSTPAIKPEIGSMNSASIKDEMQSDLAITKTAKN